MSHPNYITPAGFAALLAAHHQLFAVERPKIVEVVSWAAGNGDRSENGDYLYGRKRLREIDRELNRLARRMKDAQVVDPRRQPDKSRIFFGATVTIVNEQDVEYIYTLVGADEADSGSGRISWNPPLARALRGAQIGDTRIVTLPAGRRRQPDKARIFFGATVTIVNEQDVEYIYTLVGADEADSGSGRISWNTPIARALRGAQIGDTRIVQLPGGSRELEVVAVNYPD